MSRKVGNLHDEMLQSRRLAFAQGTNDNLKVQWKSYLLFCNYYKMFPFYTSSNNLCYFAQFLSRSFKSVDSIKNYINGVRILFLLLGFEDKIFHTFELKLTIRGLNRSLQHLPKQALPITLEILNKFYNLLDHSDRNDVTFWCLFLFAFLLMSRKSNLVPVSSKKFDNSKQLCRGDVKVYSSCLFVHFKWTKTIQFGNRVLIIPLVAMTSSIFCPVTAFDRMCELIPCSSDSPAFVKVIKGKVTALNYFHFQQKLRELIQQIGLNPLLYSSHSFRRGGATLANQAGISSNLIQVMGDWKSDAYKKYISCSITDRLLVSNKIKRFIVNKYI